MTIGAHRGPWVRGLMEASDVPPKVVAAKSGVHESTLSRFFNAKADLQDRQFGRVCLAIGEVRGERSGRGSRAV